MIVSDTAIKNRISVLVLAVIILIVGTYSYMVLPRESDPDITIVRRLKDQQISNVVARQYKRRLDNTYVLYYDLIDYDETFFYEEEIVSGKPVIAKTEIERRFDSDVPKQ